jgi:hypothetical protein
VRQALASAVPPPRKAPARSSPRLEPFQAAIEGMLRADLDAGVAVGCAASACTQGG